MTVDEAVDLLQAGDEVKDFIVVRILFAVQQVHVVVNGLLVVAGNHVQKAATSDIASAKDCSSITKSYKSQALKESRLRVVLSDTYVM